MAFDSTFIAFNYLYIVSYYFYMAIYCITKVV